MITVVQDLRQAFRLFSRHPGYLATAVVTLALGIGFSTATFSVINAVLLRPLPYRNPSELVVVRERRLPQFPEFSVAPGHFVAWRERTSRFEGIAAWHARRVDLETGSGEPERVRADRVSGNLLAVLGVSPAIGRGFTDADDSPGAPPVVVLSYGAWQRRFGGADVVGQTIRIDRRQATIVGVMPAGFTFPVAETEMWTPLAMIALERRETGSHYMGAIARMKPGVTLEQARADVSAAAAGLAQADPSENNVGWEALLFPLHEYTVRGVRGALLVLFGAVSLLLLIACANVAGLLVARGAVRQRELAIRAAMGAGGGRLVRQLLVEQFALALLAGAAGVLLAAWLLRALLVLVPAALPRQSEIRLDIHVLGFATALGFITPLLFGLFPAVQASRPHQRDLLATGGREGSGRPGRGLRQAIVVAEVALAMVLLVGAGLLIRSFSRLSSVSPGFDPDRALVANLSLPASEYSEGERRRRFFEELLSRVRQLPQVVAAGVTQSVPMTPEFQTGYEVEGEVLPGGNRPATHFYSVDRGYFEAMGIPLVRGRLFSDSDARVAVVNQTMAARHFPGEDPIGRRIKVNEGRDSESWKEIVGVVGDVKQDGLGDRTSIQIYEPFLQHLVLPRVYSLVVRTAADEPQAIVPDLRAIVRGLDGELPLSVQTLDEIVGRSIRPQRFSTTLIALFGATALLLAAVGVYGVVAYTVGSRTQEFAIRVAHGATRGDILRLVLRGAALMAGLGVAGGLGSAWALRRVVDNLLFGVTAEDGLTYAAVALLLTIVAMAASAIPAWRATRVDPVVALRQ